jgi:tripartite ATP-independent transporter DctM subunit
MEWYVVFLFVFGLLLGTMLSGIHVAFALMAVNLVGVLMFIGPHGFNLVTGSVVDSISGFALIAIPMFYLMGEILFQSRVVSLLFDMVEKWIGKIPGKHLYVAIGGGTGLAALSGSGSADTALIGRTLYPVLEERGYDQQLSYSVVLAGGALGPIIPPSGLAVILGGLANVSVGALLVSGLLPGLLLALLFALYVALRVRLNPSLAPPRETERAGWSERWISLFKCLPFCIIIFMVLGFILFGISTPSEAAATGAVGAMVVAAVYGRLSVSVLSRALLATARLTSMVFMVITGAVLFGQILALSGAESSLNLWLVQLDLPPVLLAAALLGLLLLLGTFIDTLALIVLLAPLFSTLIVPAGINPIWFFLLFLMTLPIGSMTPPVGSMIFVLKGAIPNSRIMDLYKAGLATAGVSVIGMIIVFFVPDLATVLPDFMFQR